MCNQGYRGDGRNCDGKFYVFIKFLSFIEIITDINECEINMDNCNSNAVCINVPGSFTCTCNQGYRGDGSTCTG